MIICVSRHEAPLRPPPRLRSPRPRAAASDRVLPLPFHTKLHLPLMLPLLLDLIVYRVSSPFLSLYRVPLLRDFLFQQSTDLHLAPLAARLTSPFAWVTPIWDMSPCLASKFSRITSRHRGAVSRRPHTHVLSRHARRDYPCFAYLTSLAH